MGHWVVGSREVQSNRLLEKKIKNLGKDFAETKI